MEELLDNIYDVLAGNDEYITQEEFIGEIEFMWEDRDENCIRIRTKDGDYTLTISKEE